MSLGFGRFILAFGGGGGQSEWFSMVQFVDRTVSELFPPGSRLFNQMGTNLKVF